MDRRDSDADRPTRVMGEHDGLPEGAEPIEDHTLVDHFEVMRLLDVGGMGEVYLARDTKLGRRVALKVVHPELLGSPQAMERFLFEAKATARFNHPHIVTIYTVGEHQGRPYLALEYLPGETLRERCAEQTLSLPEMLRIGLAVAEALTEAHAGGVLHRDLKPENVLIPRDGRVRVLDFGLATSVAGAGELADEAPPSSRGDLPDGKSDHRWKGTPEYMAPEQWLCLESTEAVDVWALGVMLFELVTGSLPFFGQDLRALCTSVCGTDRAPSLQELTDAPTELGELVARCLEKLPDDRPSAERVAQTLRSLIHAHRPSRDGEPTPFRGLLPFTSEHADLFFGREAEIDAALERIRTAPLVAVVGPSGAGKSSFVRAGLLPRLSEQRRWIVLTMRPGTRPFRALAAHLLPHWLPPSAAGGGPREITDEGLDELADELARTPRRLSILLREIARRRSVHLLLFVDQLEEVFTQVDDPDTTARFMTALATAADDPADPVRALFTVRDDFLGRIVTGPEAREALSCVVVLQRLSHQALVDTLIEPLRVVRYRFEDDALPDDMVASVEGEPTCLPLLQFAAQRLWEQRDAGQRLLLRAPYEQMGGVEGALAKHADGVVDAMTPAERRLARQIMLQLVTPEKTRRPVLRQALTDGLEASPTGDGGAAAVLARLTDARLLSVQRGEEGDDDAPVVELAHESLVHSWTRLARWIEESHEEIAFAAELRQAATLWDKRGRRADELWTGEALHEAHRMMKRGAPFATQLVRDFLTGADRLERRRAKRARWIVALVIGSLVLVAVILTVQKRRADELRRQAEAGEQAARRGRAQALQEGARAALGQGNVLEARAKLRGALEAQPTASAATRALWWQLSRNPLRWRKELGAPINAVAFAPSGTQVAATTQDGTVVLLDTRTRQSQVLRGHEDAVLGLAYGPAGTRLATGSYDGKVILWDVSTGRPIRELPGHRGGTYGVRFSPDGQQLGTAGTDHQVRLWDSATGRLLRTFEGHGELAFSVAFAPNGTLVASGSRDRAARIWDVATGALVRTLTGHEGVVYGVAFSPAGDHLATASGDRSVRIWAVKDGALVHRLEGHDNRVFGLAYHPGGDALATASFDNTVRIWNTSSGALQRTLRGHAGAVYGVSYSPDGQLLATAGFDQTVRLWDANQGTYDRQQVGHQAGVRGLGFAPDGSWIVTGSSDHTLRLWDTQRGTELAVLRGHDDAVRGVAVSRDGRWIASASVDKTARLWDGRTHTELRAFKGHGEGLRSVAFSPDGRQLATASFDTTVGLWDVDSGIRRTTLRGHESAVFGVQFSPGGERLASTSRDASLRLWEAHEGAERATLVGHEGPVYDLTFLPDGRTVLTAGHDQTVRRWSVAEGAVAAEAGSAVELPARVYDVACNADGTQVAMACADHAAWLLNVASGSQRALRGHRDEVTAVGFAPGGKLVASASEDGTLRLWEVATGRPFWHAPVLLSSPARLRSHQGWLGLAEPRPGEAIQPGLGPQVASAVEQRARHASEAAGRLLCLRTHDDHFELWDLAADHPIGERRGGDVRQVLGTEAGCLVRSADQVWLAKASGEHAPLSIHGPPMALGHGGGHLLVASDDEIVVYGADGTATTQSASSRGVTALTTVASAGTPEARIVTGHRDGNIELALGGTDGGPSKVTFEQVPSSPALRMLAGPKGTLIVGYANGLVGLWNLASGQRLDHARLHGAVVHLLLEGERLYAATELGQWLAWDLSAFYLEHCELLHQVWQTVPVRWDNGRPVVAPVPSSHPCARTPPPQGR